MKPTPQVFDFHDYRSYFRAWLAFKKGSGRFSLRQWAKSCGLSPSYLTMILNGDRKLTPSALSQIRPSLKLSAVEDRYLECLFVLSGSDDQESRIRAIETMQRFGRFKKNHSEEAKFYQYFSKWYYTAIRELADTSGFRMNVGWIQERLVEKIPKKDIQAALDFMISNGFLKVEEGGGISVQNKSLKCSGVVHALSLAEAHKQMFSQAVKSIDRCSKDERWLYGNTMAIAQSQLPEMIKILKEANQKIAKLNRKGKGNDSVYHTGLMVFPLAKKSEESS